MCLKRAAVPVKSLGRKDFASQLAVIIKFILSVYLTLPIMWLFRD